MKKFRVSVLAVGLVGLLAVTGCGPTSSTASTATPPAATTVTPAATPTPTPTPTPTAPALIATSIVISGRSLTVLAAGPTVLADIPFTTDGASAAAQLTSVLGASPTTTTVVASTCRRSGTNYTWGALELQGSGFVTMAPPALFTVSATGGLASAGVTVLGPGQVKVGMPAAGVSAALPSAPSAPDGFGNTIFTLEKVGGAGADTTGVLGVVTAGALARIVSSIYIFGDC